MTPKLCAQHIGLLGWGFVLFGLIWVTTSFSGMDAPGRFLIDVLHWPLDGYPNDPSMEARWMGGIGAGLTVGIGLMFSLIFAPLIRAGDQAGRIARKGTILALTGWFIVDGVGSYAAGAPSNVFFNSIFYLLAVIPLALVKFPD